MLASSQTSPSQQSLTHFDFSHRNSSYDSSTAGGTVRSATLRAKIGLLLHQFNIPLGEGSSASTAIDRFSLDQARSFSQACLVLLVDLMKPGKDEQQASPLLTVTPTPKDPSAAFSVGDAPLNTSLKSAGSSHGTPRGALHDPSKGSKDSLKADARAERLLSITRDVQEQSVNPSFNYSTSQFIVQQTRELLKTVDNDGNKVINRYTVIDDLGRGAYGKVKLAVDEANCPVAIKIVRKNLLKQLGGKNGIAREIAVMKKLKHRNVVPLYEVIDDPGSEKLYMVMKYVDQGPIAKLRPDSTCDPLPTDRLKEVMGELASGLSYLHKRGVAHRDIKPDNILMDAGGTPYFVDFGVSAIIDKDNPNVSTVEGTTLFMPPELFSEHRFKADAFAADVWSLGVTLYLLLYGKAPFTGSNYREISAAVRTSELTFPPMPNGEDDAVWQNLLQGMLFKDPAKRIKLKAIKKHPALAEDDFVTPQEVEMATSRIKNFLAQEDALLAPQDPITVRSFRSSFTSLPRCARRSVVGFAGDTKHSSGNNSLVALVDSGTMSSAARLLEESDQEIQFPLPCLSSPRAHECYGGKMGKSPFEEVLGKESAEKPTTRSPGSDYVNGDDSRLGALSITARPEDHSLPAASTGSPSSSSPPPRVVLSPSPPHGPRVKPRPEPHQNSQSHPADDAFGESSNVGREKTSKAV